MRASVAFSPASVTAMSPGTSFSSENTMKVASSITGSACNRRLPIDLCRAAPRHPPQLSSQTSSYFGLPSRFGLVALHLLVHRHQLELERQRADERVLHDDPLHLRETPCLRFSMSSVARNSFSAASSSGGTGARPALK